MRPKSPKAREDGVLLTRVDPGFVVERRLHGPASDGYLTIVTWQSNAGGGEFIPVDHWELSTVMQDRLRAILSERAAPTVETPALRPQVAAFAQLMEAKLRDNDHKPGWAHDGTDALIKRLHEEARELQAATETSGAWCSAPPSAALGREQRMHIGREAADVANFAMMIADVCGALAPAPATPEPPPRSGQGEAPRYFGRPGHCVDINGDWWHEPGTCIGAAVNCDGKCCGPRRTDPAAPGPKEG